MTVADLERFSNSRGLKRGGTDGLRALTPTLLPAARGGLVARADGRLAEGLEGSLLMLKGGGGGEATVVLCHVSGSKAFMPALSCRSRDLGRGPLEELPAERWERTELESAGFNRRYSLLSLRGQDAGLVRELFSPSLIAWLERDPPPGFSFEMNEGNLTMSLPGHLDEEQLGAFCAAAAQLNERIAAEIEEEDLDPDLFDESEKVADIERGLADVGFQETPVGVQDAVARVKRRAARKPRVLLVALLWALVLGAAIGAAATAAAGPAAGVIFGGLVFLGVFILARAIGAAAYRWGTAAVGRVALEGFARGYASSRGLEIEDRWRFHSSHRDLPVPGFADHVFAGELPETGGLRGRLLMLGDAAELRTLGQEVAFFADRPLASSALLVEAPEGPRAPSSDGVDVPAEYTLDVTGRWILVWRPVQGNLIRTCAGTDRFCAKAGVVVRDVLARQSG